MRCGGCVWTCGMTRTLPTRATAQRKRRSLASLPASPAPSSLTRYSVPCLFTLLSLRPAACARRVHHNVWIAPIRLDARSATHHLRDTPAARWAQLAGASLPAQPGRDSRGRNGARSERPACRTEGCSSCWHILGARTRILGADTWVAAQHDTALIPVVARAGSGQDTPGDLIPGVCPRAWRQRPSFGGLPFINSQYVCAVFCVVSLSVSAALTVSCVASIALI